MTSVPTSDARHVPVLLNQALHHLQPRAGSVIVDGTFGFGGYSRALLNAGASVIAIDRDPEAIAGGQSLVQSAGARLALVEGRFGRLDEIAREAGYERVDGVVLDIGVSSMQLDTAERGFSFGRDGPLDMRMGRDGPTASEVVNSLAVRDLARVIAVLGEEKKAGAVARAIDKARAEGPIARTGELATIVERAVGGRRGDQIHPATRTFQALRIYVNEELAELADGLAAAERILGEDGRLVVVSFHSLEDRIVKRFLADRSATVPRGTRHRPAEALPAPTFRLLTRRPVSPGADEIANNPRARSARLRAAARTSAPARAGDRGLLGLPELGIGG